NDPERAFRWILIEIRHPGLQTTLRLIHAIPAVFRRVRIDPGASVALHLTDGDLDPRCQASQLCHAAARLPLGLPSDVSLQPEAVLVLADECQNLIKLRGRNEVTAATQERALLESACVDGSESSGRQLRPAKA